MMIDSEETKEVLYEYPEAPCVIYLNDDEKFKDSDGNSVEIETRGDSTVNGTYFSAKDVSRVFEMPNLVDTLKKKTTNYTNDDYKIFVCKNTEKEVFITYRGMLKIIFCSRNYNTKLNDLVLMNWVQNAAGICQLMYEPKLLNLNRSIGFAGIVYFVSCDLLNGIKIGFWRSSLELLKKRYMTPYGKNVKILFCRTQNAPELEKEIHREFKKDNLSNEIFKKDKLNEYINFVKDCKNLKLYDYDNCTLDEIKLKTEFDLIYKLPEFQSHMNNRHVQEYKTHTENQCDVIKCLCMISLGIAKDLRKSMNLSKDIADDNIIIINISTNKLDPLLDEHVQEYGKISGVNLNIMKYVYIDPKFLYQAEVDIKDYFTAVETPVVYKSYKEIVAINPKHEKLIKKQFDYIGTEYQGSITELIIQIEKLKLKIETIYETHKWELKDKDRIIDQKNIIIEKKNIEIENVKLKNEIIEMKLKNI